MWDSPAPLLAMPGIRRRRGCNDKSTGDGDLTAEPDGRDHLADDNTRRPGRSVNVLRVVTHHAATPQEVDDEYGCGRQRGSHRDNEYQRRKHGNVGPWDDDWSQHKQRLQHGHQEVGHHGADECPDGRSDDNDARIR